MKYTLLILTIIFLTNCQNTEENSTDQIEAEILREIDGLSQAFTKSDLKWVDYYQQEYTTISTNGLNEINTTDDLRKTWGNTYKKYEVILRDHGKPTLLISQGQVVHYNTYDEIFINRETRDTTVSLGTWIVVWKKQENDTWKINLETYHVTE